MCVELWDLLSLNDQRKTFSRRRTISIGTVEKDAGRRPVLFGADELVGNTENILEQKVRIFVLLRTVILRLQALSVTQPIPAITMEKE